VCACVCVCVRACVCVRVRVCAKPYIIRKTLNSLFVDL
jgi:hypothetical protein